MKRLIIILTILTMIFTLMGCVGKNGNNNAANKSDIIEDIDSVDNSNKVYYISSIDGTITGYVHEYHAANADELLKECIDLLAGNPLYEGMNKVIPDGVVVKNYSYSQSEKAVIINFNNAYNNIAPNDEILIRAIIVKTFTQFEGINYITFQVEGETVKEKNGKPAVMMGKDFVDNTMADIKNITDDTFILYFATSDNLQLYENEFYVHYLSGYSKERVILEGLIAGPVNKTLNSTLSPDTIINSISTSDGLCTVDFNYVFLTPVENQSFDIKVFSVVNSLCRLDYIDKVKIIINGHESEYEENGVNLRMVFRENPELIMKPTSAPSVEVDMEEKESNN